MNSIGSRGRRDRFVAGIGVVGLFVVVAATACSEPDWTGGDLDGSKTDAAKASPTPCPPGQEEVDVEEPGSAGATPAPASGSGKPGIDVDVSTLAACCEDKGKAHCVPENKIGESTRASLEACGGGLCVPDTIIEGKPPAECSTGFSGDSAKGVCVSLCVKAVAEKASLLKQQTCGANEVCTPCISPLDGKRTGVCELGKGGGGASGGTSTSSTAGGQKTSKQCRPKADGGASKPTGSGGSGTDAGASSPGADGGGTNNGGGGGGGGAAGCCGGEGICVPPAVVPEAQRSHLEAKECTGGNLCAPKSLADKNAKPKTCKGNALTGAFTGVCLSNCLVFGFLEEVISDQGTCDPDERCVPCNKPIIGTPTGAPGCG